MRNDERFFWWSIGVLTGAIIMIGCILLADKAADGAEAQYASWYSVASCEKESGQHIMANGQPLDDTKFTCASWDYPFGTVVRVRHGERSVNCVVTDRGPARRLYRKGVIIDLTRAAFLSLAPLEKGRIAVSIQEVEQ
ncbi:MAG: septal ring lytic transglycosylase RlpA family protein [bacterium]